MKQITKKQAGFTLIEVVLVLAIGALIILMALLAFGGAQRARRDTARQDAVGKIASSVEQYASNSNGDYPTDTTTLQSATGNVTDPLSGNKPTYAAGDVAASGTLTFATGQKCDPATGKTVAVTASPRIYAISYKQESGKLGCKDNVN